MLSNVVLVVILAMGVQTLYARDTFQERKEERGENLPRPTQFSKQLQSRTL